MTQNLTLWIEEYITDLYNRNYSKNTTFLYQTYLTKYTQFHNKLTTDKVWDFVNKHGGDTPASKNTVLSIFRSFQTWLLDEEYIQGTFLKSKDVIKTPKYVHRALTDQQVEGLKQSIRALPLKYQAAYMLLIELGVRIEELVSLEVQNICLDPESPHVYVFGKGKKERLLPLESSTEAFKLLKGYIDTLQVSEGPLWTSQRGTKESNSNFRKKWEAQVSKEHTFHDLRHSFASRMARNGVSLEQIQDLLGHDDINTTRRYVKTDMDQLHSKVREVLKNGQQKTPTPV